MTFASGSQNTYSDRMTYTVLGIGEIVSDRLL